MIDMWSNCTCDNFILICFFALYLYTIPFPRPLPPTPNWPVTSATLIFANAMLFKYTRGHFRLKKHRANYT